jgi:hypothetical protein
MTVGELRDKLNIMAEINEKSMNLELMIPAKGRGAQGGTSAYKVKGVIKGIDWDHKFFFILPEVELIKFTK